MLRTLLTCLLGLNAVLPAASIGPRVVSQEEILEMVDEWLYTFDEDDDSFLAGSELEGLLKQLRQGSSVTGDAAAALTPQLLMTQVRSVCPAACVLRRKKTVSHCIRPPPPTRSTATATDWQIVRSSSTCCVE